MKSEAVKALEVEIQELSDKMENLAKARALLVYPKEKKARKPRKVREPKEPKTPKAPKEPKTDIPTFGIRHGLKGDKTSTIPA
jgi:hypothetical protein